MGGTRLSVIAASCQDSARHRRLLRVAGQRLRSRGFAVEVQLAPDRTAARDLAARVAAGGGTAVAVGGDGLIAAVAEGVVTAGAGRLAVLPAGRGNDFARALAIPRDLEGALALLCSGQSRRID